MKSQSKLPDNIIFSVDDVDQYYNNIESARSAVKRLMKYNKILKIRNNMYTYVDVKTGEPKVDKYEVASCITPTSYISHESALEYYGVSTNEIREVYVSSQTSFRTFEFQGYRFKYVPAKYLEGIIEIKRGNGLKITDKERTLVDIVKEINRINQLENIKLYIEKISSIKEEALLRYMELYNNQFLFQKIGFILSEYKNTLHISDEVFEICKGNIGKSKRYMVNNCARGIYDSTWKLVVPSKIY